jgi:hypothetical protein
MVIYGWLHSSASESTLFGNDLRVGSKLFVRVPLNVCQTGGITQQIYYAEVDFVKWDFNCE